MRQLLRTGLPPVRLDDEPSRLMHRCLPPAHGFVLRPCLSRVHYRAPGSFAIRHSSVAVFQLLVVARTPSIFSKKLLEKTVIP